MKVQLRNEEKAEISIKKTAVSVLKCLRCGHEWYPRRFEKPKVCSKCNSPYWNKKRVMKKRTNKDTTQRRQSL